MTPRPVSGRVQVPGAVMLVSVGGLVFGLANAAVVSAGGVLKTTREYSSPPVTANELLGRLIDRNAAKTIACTLAETAISCTLLQTFQSCFHFGLATGRFLARWRLKRQLGANLTVVARSRWVLRAASRFRVEPI